MTEEVNVGMGAPAPKKGMSKGCLVAIIVGVVLLVIVGITIYMVTKKKSDILNFGLSLVLNSSKQVLLESNVEGIDTVYYNTTVDDFLTILYADTIVNTPVEDSIKFVELSNILTYTQGAITDQKLDSDETNKILKSLVTKYPDIVPDIPDTEIIDSLQTE